MDSHEASETYAHVRASFSTWEKASLAVDFDAAVLRIDDTHSPNAGTRASYWLGLIGTINATLLWIGAQVAGF